MKHDPERGPWLVNGRGGQAVSTERTVTRTRTKSQPAVRVTDPKTRKTREIPRVVTHHRIGPPR